MTCEPASLRNPSLALRFARQAVDAAPDNPVYLDTLALAYFHTGDQGRALETGTLALTKLPPQPPGTAAAGLRAEIEGHMAMFKKGA